MAIWLFEFEPLFIEKVLDGRLEECRNYNICVF
jgi:hypothetical protein